MDHPRTCGENIVENYRKDMALGSPPHLRGKQYSLSSPSQRFRITPAPAGKTLKHNLIYQGCQDHPRTCGENRVGVNF